MPGERHVELLSGRAFFKVAHNPSRPFTVTAAGKRVRAIGTAFEVSMNGGEVAVVLAEGKVRVEEVEKAGNGTDMTPGRQLVLTDRRWTMSHVDVKKEPGWAEGRARQSGVAGKRGQGRVDTGSRRVLKKNTENIHGDNVNIKVARRYG